MGGAILQKHIEEHSLPGAVLLSSAPAKGVARMFLKMLYRHPLAALKTLLTLNSFHLVETPKLAQDWFLSEGVSIDVDQFHKSLVRESITISFQLLLPFAKLNKVTSPVLVMAGEKDVIFTVSEGEATAKKYKAKCVVFEGQAHNLMLEPNRLSIANVIDEWITKKLKLP